MALFVGAPVNALEMSDPVDSDALIPQAIRRMPKAMTTTPAIFCMMCSSIPGDEGSGSDQRARPAAGGEAPDERDQEDDDEDEEQHAGDIRGPRRDSSEPENRRDDRDQQECRCPSQHDPPPYCESPHAYHPGMPFPRAGLCTPLRTRGSTILRSFRKRVDPSAEGDL